jgi:hypothetical protein
MLQNHAICYRVIRVLKTSNYKKVSCLSVWQKSHFHKSTLFLPSFVLLVCSHPVCSVTSYPLRGAEVERSTLQELELRACRVLKFLCYKSLKDLFLAMINWILVRKNKKKTKLILMTSLALSSAEVGAELSQGWPKLIEIDVDWWWIE